MNETKERTSIIHKFEAAGLGAAPYQFIGGRQMTYQACHGAPIQPGGCCDFCGTAIVNAFFFRSSDGKEFKVGSDCVRKSGDEGLFDRVKAAARAIVREAKRVKDLEERKKNKETAMLALENSRAVLASFPHRNTYFAASGKTLFDEFDWLIQNVGNARLATMPTEISAALAKAEGR